MELKCSLWIENREFKKLLRRRRRQRRLKNEFIFYLHESRNTLKLFTLFITVKAIAKLNLGHRNKFELAFKKLAVVVHVLRTMENRPFAGYGHMVRKKLRWDANNAGGLWKQRNSYQSSPTFLCFESPTALFASQCNLFRTMWPDIGHFTLLFCRGRQRSVQRVITHVQNHCSVH